MAPMSKDQRAAYLADLHVGVMAVERPDRAPLTVPIWYWFEDGEVTIWLQSDSIKASVIEAAGRFAISAQDEAPPYKYVTAEGDVTSTTPATEEDVIKMAVRYLGEDAGPQFAKDSHTPKSILIRMRPTRWLSVDYSS